MTSEEKIAELEKFRALLKSWEDRKDYPTHRRRIDPEKVRSQINQTKGNVRRIIVEQRCMKLLTIAPPPAVGGMVLRNVDPFDLIFDPPYLHSMIPTIVDMLDETIGSLRVEAEVQPSESQASGGTVIKTDILNNFAFVAMPMEPGNHRLVDVLDAIKEAAQRCGVQAERIDDQASNERITDRILESIQKAEFVIADLTDARPNVYFEVGYAHGLGKLPIYIAAADTKLEFDLKDYPVVFFKGLRDLKDGLEKRMRAIRAKAAAG